MAESLETLLLADAMVVLSPEKKTDVRKGAEEGGIRVAVRLRPAKVRCGIRAPV